MKFLLDSNIVIAASLGTGGRLRAKMAECREGDLVTSAIAYAEVVFGSTKGKPPPLDKIRLLIEEIPVLPFDAAAAEVYATTPFKRGSYDQLIAAHALALGLTVITNNRNDFRDIPGLSVEDWLSE